MQKCSHKLSIGSIKVNCMVSYEICQVSYLFSVPNALTIAEWEQVDRLYSISRKIDHKTILEIFQE